MALRFQDPTVRSHRRTTPSAMGRDVRRSLLSRPPSLPSKYFYDDRGSALFEEITRLPEYYQTRTEEGILARVAGEVIRRVRPSELVELGSGAGRKIRMLIDALLASDPRRGVAKPRLLLFDINATFVRDSVRTLAGDYPELQVDGQVGDFTGSLEDLGAGGGRLALLLAGTIGNLVPSDSRAFLRRMAGPLSPGDGFLIGLDLVKDPAVLERAYNDAAGVTAEFNLNILEHVNRALAGDFDTALWRHRAFYDERNQWIEMRLVATADQRVRIEGAGLDLHYAPGDEIITEYSCKYTRASFEGLLEGSGLELETWHSDAADLFALALLRRVGR